MSFESPDAEQDGSEMDPPDPFTREIHTGDRVLAYVNSLLDARPDSLEIRTASFMKHAELNRTTYEKMLGELTPEEQIAFKCALAKGLEDFYYTHYRALYRRLHTEELGGEEPVRE